MESLSLRDRIAAVQQAHIFRITKCSCGYMFPWEKSTEWRERAEREWARHVADVILAIPGIAVVELPEPDRGGGYGDDGVGWGTDNNSVFTSGGMVYDQCGEFSPAQAREIGLRWLAAADYTERDQ